MGNSQARAWMSASRRKVCERSSRMGSTRGSAGWLARDDCGKSDQLGFDWTEMIANNEKKEPPSDDYRRCWTTEEEFIVDVRLESWGRTHSEVQAKSSQEQAPSLITRGRTTGRSCEGGLDCCSLIQCIVTNANATQQQTIERRRCCCRQIAVRL